MARIRTIKPSFFKSEDVSALSIRARLTWVGLWTFVDDEGRGKDNPRLIKGELYPLDDDVTLEEIENDLSELARHGRITRYTVAGRSYLAVPNWRAHQSISKATASRLPAPPDDDSTTPPAPLPESSGSTPRGKGREGKGREGTRARATPPPRTCDEHTGMRRPPPCGACADARKAADAYDAEQRARLNAAPECPRHRGQPA